MPTSEGALAGVRVIELGQLIAGPFCGQLLGDMGADVIKVEPAGAGDPMRGWGAGADKVWWEVLGRNKRSVTADLRVAAGQDLVRRLAERADILVENFRPGSLERWGLSPAALMAANPRLVVVRVSGFGQSGPYAERAGFGAIGEAMGGWRHIVGDPDRPPSRMGVSIGDSLAASYAALAAVAALHARGRTGAGQVIDCALYEAVLQVMESLVVDYDRNGVTRERSGAILPGIAPSNVYACADGSLVIGANQDPIFARLCEAMGAPGLAADPRFATHAARGENQALLDGIIAAWTAERGVEEVEAAMVAHSVPAGRIYRAPEMLADPHFAARGALVSVETERFGPLKMQNAFPFFSATPSGVRRPAPSRPGQHNAEVYATLGLTPSDLAALARDGVI